MVSFDPERPDGCHEQSRADAKRDAPTHAAGPTDAATDDGCSRNARSKEL